MKNFISVDNLPIGKKFIDLPYKNETVEFTGVVSEEQSTGTDSFKSAQIIIRNNRGKSMLSSLPFYYDINHSNFVKSIDCNFYPANEDN